jgi:hypothetical protein
MSQRHFLPQEYITSANACAPYLWQVTQCSYLLGIINEVQAQKILLSA